ncbi:MAG: hypothetical protein AAF393_11920 [Pseudomonadota bacterium]
MAGRFSAPRLIAVLAALAVAPSCAPNAGSGQAAFSWEPETSQEKALRHKAEALQATVGEGASAGFVLGAVIGGLTGGYQGAFTGAKLGRVIGAASGAYVRQLQSEYAAREAQLDQLAEDLEANNRDIESAIATMRAVLGQQRAKLAAAKATGNPNAVRRASEQAAGNLSVMNKAVEAAVNRQNVFGEARSLLAVPASTEAADSPLDSRYAVLAVRISAMRSIADTLAEEI